jgi:hypothetical protein
VRRLVVLCVHTIYSFKDQGKTELNPIISALKSLQEQQVDLNVSVIQFKQIPLFGSRKIIRRKILRRKIHRRNVLCRRILYPVDSSLGSFFARIILRRRILRFHFFVFRSRNILRRRVLRPDNSSLGSFFARIVFRRIIYRRKVLRSDDSSPEHSA